MDINPIHWFIRLLRYAEYEYYCAVLCSVQPLMDGWMDGCGCHIRINFAPRPIALLQLQLQNRIHFNLHFTYLFELNLLSPE